MIYDQKSDLSIVNLNGRLYYKSILSQHGIKQTHQLCMFSCYDSTITGSGSFLIPTDRDSSGTNKAIKLTYSIDMMRRQLDNWYLCCFLTPPSEISFRSRVSVSFMVYFLQYNRIKKTTNRIDKHVYFCTREASNKQTHYHTYAYMLSIFCHSLSSFNQIKYFR